MKGHDASHESQVVWSSGSALFDGKKKHHDKVLGNQSTHNTFVGVL
jgi:hypothetical protein